MYTHDLPVTVARKFVYADDLAIMHSAEDWQPVEGTLTQDMATLLSYLRKWKLKLSTTKTVTAAFHLYNKETSRELKVAADGRILPFSAEPTHPGVKLDRSLSCRRQLESQPKKLATRVGLLRRLAGSSWGAGARTLSIATLALIHFAAECCVPIWSRNAHTRLIDKLINDALRLDVCVPHQRTTYLLYQASHRLSFVEREPHCLWVVVPRSLVIYSTIGSRPTLMEGIDRLSQDTLCACCSGTAQRCKQTEHHCSKMGGPQMEHWVAGRHLSSAFVF